MHIDNICKLLLIHVLAHVPVLWGTLMGRVGVMQAAVKGEGAGLGPSSEQQQQELHQKQAEAKATHIGTNTMGMVLDLLCFCVQHHGYR